MSTKTEKYKIGKSIISEGERWGLSKSGTCIIDLLCALNKVRNLGLGPNLDQNPENGPKKVQFFYYGSIQMLVHLKRNTKSTKMVLKQSQEKYQILTLKVVCLAKSQISNPVLRALHLLCGGRQHD